MLKIGDRISRQIEIGKPERRYGVIVHIYKSTQGYGTTPVKMVDIKFDGSDCVERGFFEPYLQIERD